MRDRDGVLRHVRGRVPALLGHLPPGRQLRGVREEVRGVPQSSGVQGGKDGKRVGQFAGKITKLSDIP